ncbi:MAG TPA: hypothetical protein VMJ64_01870 [Anaerolineales bacterium]|nr:hypothetical protein [Anaerolineales bacterium]
MPPTTAAKAKQGMHLLVDEAEQLLQKAVSDHGARAPFSYPNTAYYLPIILGHSAKPVERVGDLQPVLQEARGLLGGPKAERGTAALLAAETIEALRSVERPLEAAGERPPASLRFESPISDAQLRTWGVQLSDGRIPGIGVILASQGSSVPASEVLNELRRRNILCFLSGAAESTHVEAGVMDQGRDAVAAIHAFGMVARCAMKLGGQRPGTWQGIQQYAKRHAPGFVLLLGEPDNVELAMALAAKELGFAVVEAAEALSAKGDADPALQLAEACIAARKLKTKAYSVSAPVPYSPAFEDEVIGDADLYAELGGQGHAGFELLQVAPASEVTDGRVRVIGPELQAHSHSDLGIVIKVAGRKLQTDFEPLLEKQIGPFLNYAGGVVHSGHEDSVSIRISEAAAAQGLTLEALGNLLLARYREDVAAVEQIEITLFTEPQEVSNWIATARQVYAARRQHLTELDDSQADVFFVCTNCRAFAPNNVSIISPQRVSPCGQCTWLDAKAGYEMGFTRVRRPIKPGKLIDGKRGVWEGLNKYAQTASHGRVKEVALYSVTQSPMSACADFECIVMAIPEANGVMVLSHDDVSPTPAGVNVEIFASIAAGEQIPGVVGIGVNYLLSPKFIAADGGFRRVVWMSSVLKERFGEELRAACARDGVPDLMEKIADERHVRSVPELVGWLKEHHHPALEMEPIFELQP